MDNKHNIKKELTSGVEKIKSRISELEVLKVQQLSMEQSIVDAQRTLDRNLEKRMDRLKNINEEILSELDERRWKDEQLKINEERYMVLFERVSSMLVVSDQGGNIKYVNKPFEKKLGYSREELIGRHVSMFHPTEEKGIVSRKFRMQIGKEFLNNIELTYITKGGDCINCLIQQTEIRGICGEELLGCLIEDITELKGTEDAFERSKEKVNNYSSNDSWIWETNKKGLYTYVSPNVSNVLGYEYAEVVGKTIFDFMPEDEARRFEDLFTCVSKKIAPLSSVENIRFHSNGQRVMLETSCVPIVNRRGEFDGYRGIDYNLQEKKRMRWGSHDPLTGLSNRMLLTEHFKRELSFASRNKKKLAVLFLDLDRFKEINDTFGHSMGDNILQGVSDRLKKCLRGCDTISRFGGDEFVLLLSQIELPEDAAKLANKIIEILKEPFNFDKGDIFITTSIGIAMYPDDGKDAQALLTYADIAMYRAKEDGKNTYKLYTPSMNVRVLEKIQLDSNMHVALGNKEFLMYYQPQVDLENGRVIGLEAFLRWEHPNLGLLSPAKFIGMAEKNGLIVPIGKQMLMQVCKQNKEWQNRGFSPVKISVNLSERQLKHGNLLEMTTQILEDSELEPKWLTFEFTENSIMKDGTISTLEKLKGIGINLAIDDFGIGYSSLSRLKSLPVDTIKIDSSFIKDITSRECDTTIVKGIITISHALGIRVIAEGVETAEQLRFLRGLKCDEMQGHLFSPALPKKDIDGRYESWFEEL